MTKTKLVVGIYSLAGCEGCRHEILNLGEELLKLLKEYDIEIAYEPLLGFTSEREEYDIVFVEGAVASKEDIEKLKEIRRKAKILIALGSCSLLGGIPGLMKDVGKEGAERVYGDKVPVDEVVEGEPITKYVKVDYWLRGCPINKWEFLSLVKKIAEGKWFRQGERRFEFCREYLVNIKGKILYLDAEKCIICGRCIGVCRELGVYAIGTINRGINIAISTPFQEPFENTTCILCGLCAAYCPVGAINYRSDIGNVQKLLASETKPIAYIEFEALAALAEAENVHPGKIITALRDLGFDKVIVWSPLSELKLSHELNIVPASEAEYKYVNQFYPELRKYLVRPPPIRLGYRSVLITQCVARKLHGEYVLTTRELQTMLSKLDLESYKPSKPDQVIAPRIYGFVKAVGPYEVKGILEAVKRGLIKAGTIVLYICPDGCIMGGGQPYSKSPFEVCVECRKRMLETVEKLFLETVHVK